MFEAFVIMRSRKTKSSIQIYTLHMMMNGDLKLISVMLLLFNIN